MLDRTCCTQFKKSSFDPKWCYSSSADCFRHCVIEQRLYQNKPCRIKSQPVVVFCVFYLLQSWLCIAVWNVLRWKPPKIFSPLPIRWHNQAPATGLRLEQTQLSSSLWHQFCFVKTHYRPTFTNSLWGWNAWNQKFMVTHLTFASCLHVAHCFDVWCI